VKIRQEDVDRLEAEAAAHLPAVASEAYPPQEPEWFLRLLERAAESLRRARTWEARRAS
jgi:hypothetical protein